MIEVPEELIERAALTLQDHHTVEEKWRTDHWEYRCACAEICDLADVLNHKAEQALAAVLPDLIAAIEAEYSEILTLADLGSDELHMEPDELWHFTPGSVFVRRVP